MSKAHVSKVVHGLAAMEAKLADQLPEGPGWQFEPKWDGFRCLIFRTGDSVELMSKSGKSLARFFPEIVALIARLPATEFIFDGELLILVNDVARFDALQARLHPAASRIARLSTETPAQLIVFDCLKSGGRALHAEPLSARRTALEQLVSTFSEPALLLSPTTIDPTVAAGWLAASGGALDGVIAKKLDAPYRPGERSMVKVKQQRSADCVVGGFRYETGRTQVASLLLGLYDENDLLNHVGYTSSIAEKDRGGLTKQLEALIAQPGFTGKTPGGPSRWTTTRSGDWQPLRPKLVVEVVYDQITGDRFRHGTKLYRWRLDKAPTQCRIEQLRAELRPSELAEIL